ncbi:MAG: isochorismatase family protein [Clostridiales Family XIII bacterium]|jgi:nicotinamidase-related amidase|nr:isochorismatase family protein [Clostridiales Family XIII bacterium]
MTDDKKTFGATDAALIVIDMQEKLVLAMHEMHNLIHRTETLLKGCVLLNLPIIFTQQYTKGLGETIAPIRDAYIESVLSMDENVKLATEDQFMQNKHVEFSHIEKTAFSAAAEPAFMDALEAAKRREVLLCGIESHVCVLQTAEDLLDRGYAVKVAADATASRREIDADFAYARMARKGITVTTSEALLFEIMEGSEHPMFRQVSALVR